MTRYRKLSLAALALAVLLPVGLAPAARDTVRVACVGDSITFGAGIRDRAKNSYPAQLQRLLGDEWQVKNFGVNGATLLKKGDKPYWKQRAWAETLKFQPNVVVIKLGTNDTKPQNWQHKAEFAADCKAMIAALAALPSKPKIWVCYPVPAFPDRWGIRDSVIKGEVIPILKTVVKDTGVGSIDLYSALTGKAKLFPDKIHPNAEGAGIMAKTIHDVLTGQPPAPAPGKPDTSVPAGGFPGRKSVWQGYDRYSFVLDGRQCQVVVPKQPAAGKPWVWRARFFGHEPQADVALLGKGFHVVYMDVANLYGCPKAVAHWNAFYAFLTREHGLAPKAALEGMSRGGLIIYNWAEANPDKVACIYGDAPVLDFKSWPGGKGKGQGGGGAWATCKKAYGLTEEQAMAYGGNPVDNLAPLAKAKIPLLHICGAADKVVPVAENTAILAERYKKLGGEIQVILKEGVGHHPHSLKDPAPIVAFILKHAAAQ